MNDYLRQTEDMFRNATAVKMPENLQAFAADGLAKTRETCEKMTAAAVDATKAMEKVSGLANQGVHTLGEHVMTNFAANTSAAFEAAQAVVHAKSLPEAAQLQAEFMRTQMTKGTEQTRAFFELSNKIVRDTFESFTSAARAFTPPQR
jgi:hypothetical protein